MAARYRFVIVVPGRKFKPVYRDSVDGGVQFCEQLMNIYAKEEIGVIKVYEKESVVQRLHGIAPIVKWKQIDTVKVTDW